MASEERYIVVQDLGRAAAGFQANQFKDESPTGPPRTLGKSMQSVQTDILKGTVELSIHSDLDQKQADEARKDDKTIGVALVMPTALIAPFAGEASDGEVSWGVEEVGAVASGATGEGVKVAVLDTGIDKHHVAFAGKTITEKDFSGDGNGDRQGHGTHCAGTIFGKDVDGVRIGVAPGVTDILIGKVLNDQGSGDTAMLFSGLQWAVDNGADVISMSLGFDYPGLVRRLVEGGWPADRATSVALVNYRENLRLLDNLMERLRILADSSRGAVVVAASGNESKAGDTPPYRIAAALPASALGLISVGAAEWQPAGLKIADFSNTLPRFAAPGVNIRSAKAGTARDLVAFNGTSMATPHVAGIAALWWQRLRESDGDNVKVRHVEAAMMTRATTDRFLPAVDPVDRGDGLVKAP
jgi:subtilisin family serine protease